MRSKVPEDRKRSVKVSFMTTKQIAETIQKQADMLFSGNVSLYMHTHSKNNIQER
jgi:hypothetical protein